MAKFTLHKILRVKKDGTPAAGASYRYEVKDEQGVVVNSRETDREFTVAQGGEKYWSYGANIRTVNKDRGSNIAYLVKE